ncbi:uncharacterized protein si:dkey-196h17.9 isoform X2 [Tachysurus fulvidraco]|uniref:uncharacterized protein si:dkey-196h17.9 isoform X2 n=1 Tax=Tachysurus fulvidraco TaxID=1234273 RepID=UPI001FEDDC26|nr:uncharacterized protein si:dkey-196h17.9 isoform X2 [Tachysurus fulvidraco]
MFASGKTRKMLRKTWKQLFKKKSQDRKNKSLVSRICSDTSEPGVENPSQNSWLMKTKDKFDEDPCLHGREKNIPILTDALKGAKHIQELIDAAEKVKKWKNQNGTTPHGNTSSGTCSQCTVKDFLMTVEIFVENNFPTMPTNSQTPTEEYLNDAMGLICGMVTSLVPVLDDSILVNYLLDSYNKRLFGMLFLLLDKSSSVNDSFFLLQWVKKTYFRQDHKGCMITGNSVLNVSDPLLLADWLQYSKQKLLTLFQGNISTTLHNILQHDQPNSVGEDSNEEAFLQVQIDVIQASETISHTIKNAVQRICCDELHTFIQKYMNAQGADESNLLCHFKRLYTCRQLRSYALSIVDPNNNTDTSTIKMLENMETQSLSSVQQCFGKLAKDNLKKYFNNEDGHLQNIIDIIPNMLATLPKVQEGVETKQLIVKAAYHSVTKAYLQCLMQRKYKKLEKRWNDVEMRIKMDAEYLNYNFVKQNESDHEQKILLLKMVEIVQCRTLDTLKLLCSELYMEFPKESEEYIPALLHWRGTFSRSKIKKVIDVSRDTEGCFRNGDHVRFHSCIYWWCCFCKM